MSHIGEYVSISATNAGAIIDALTAQLREAQSMKDYYCGQVVQLTAEAEAQAAEVKRLQGELEAKNANPEAPSRKYKVGDRVFGNCGKAGVIVSINSSPGAHFPYLVLYSHGEIDLHSESFLSPAPSEASDDALPTV